MKLFFVFLWVLFFISSTGECLVNGDPVLSPLNDINITSIPVSDLISNGPNIDDIAAGESITVMDCVYLYSDGEWYKTDADAVATSKGMLGISLESKSDGEMMLVALSGSFVRNDAWNWTIGGIIYLSTVIGELTQTLPNGADDVIRKVGWAVSVDVMYFEADNTVIINA